MVGLNLVVISYVKLWVVDVLNVIFKVDYCGRINGMWLIFVFVEKWSVGNEKE